MAVFETWLKSDLKKPVVVQKLAGNLFSADNGGNKIGVEIFDDGASASVTGGVTGYIVRDDNATVIVTGTLSGNKASIILPQSAYTVVGNISIVIKVGTTTVGACVGYVYRTTTDTMVDPGHVIPSIEELLAKIAACEQATTNANAATTSANNAATNANTAATSANNAATSATTAAGNANTAAGSANTAASAIANMTVSASGLPAGSTPTATISEVSGHKHIAFGLVKGDKGNTGDPGKDFHIAKTFSSVSAMMNYTGTDIEAYDFAMIDTGSVQDPDTGKLYCYEPDKTPKWQYIGDLSGAQGVKGETGTGIDHVALNQDYTLTIYLDNGTSYTTGSIRGTQGDPGVSPVVTISTISGGHRVTVTDAQGANSFDVMDGVDSYLHIRYSAIQPTADSDMKTTPDEWIGVYTGTSATAPTSYTAYAWYKFKGETGSAENVYGTTVPLSPQDSTKVTDAIAGKVNANQGAGNAGKALGIDNTGAVVPVPFSGDDFTGATASTAGVHGYVPAPAAGDQGKSLFGDGTWKQVADPADVSSNTIAIAKIDKAYDLGNHSSLSSLETAITTFANTLALNETRPIKFYAVSNIGLFKGYNFYAGHLTMLNATTHLYEAVVTSQDGNHIVISYNGSAFKYNEIATKSGVPVIIRKTSNHNSETTNASGYIQIDTYESLGVSGSLYCMSMIIRGWTGAINGMSVAKGSNGSAFYLIGPPSTTLTNFSVEYFFVDLVS